MSSADDFEVIVELGGFDQLPGRVTAGAAQALRENAMDLLSIAAGANQAQHPGAPVDEGTLRGSGTAHFGGERIAVSDAPTEQGADPTPLSGGAETDDHTAAVAFNTVYAAFQHERTDLVHPKGGAAKYLQAPLQSNSTLYFRRLGEGIGDALEGP